MLFQISWTLHEKTKIDCYKIFSDLKTEDELKGLNVTIVGRWHHVGGGWGTCLCETDNSETLAKWMMGWTGMCDITVYPMIEDEPMRKVIKEVVA